jgi:hypothetical protein
LAPIRGAGQDRPLMSRVTVGFVLMSPRDA